MLVPTGLAIDSCGPLPILQRALLASMAPRTFGMMFGREEEWDRFHRTSRM